MKVKGVLIPALFASALALSCSDGDTINNYYYAEDAGGGGGQPAVVENTAAMCSDNLDNDGNGKVDCQDEGCQDFAFCGAGEEGKEDTLAACQDKKDNDGDGKADCDDEDCKAFTICQEKVEENTAELCQDHLDNDGDGKIDCDDEGCQTFSFCSGVSIPMENTPELCQDGRDNDGDGKVDCQDMDCWAFSVCADAVAVDENSRELCQDGKDNDFDGKVDCDDDGCADLPVCNPDMIRGEICGNGQDDDGDGRADCDDSECAPYKECHGMARKGENTREACSDGKDNDGDGYADCADAECHQFSDLCVDTCPDSAHFKFLTAQMAAADKCGCDKVEVNGECYAPLYPRTNEEIYNEFLARFGDSAEQKKYALMGDIVFQPDPTTDDGLYKWKGLTVSGLTLDGQGHRIVGQLSHDFLTDTDGCGLFRTMTDSTVSNLGVDLTFNCIFKRTPSAKIEAEAGTLAAFARNTTFKNITSRSKMQADVEATIQKLEHIHGATFALGGLVGRAIDCDMEDIDVDGNASLKFDLGEAVSAYITPTYKRDLYLGGVVGQVVENSSSSESSPSSPRYRNIRSSGNVTLSNGIGSKSNILRGSVTNCTNQGRERHFVGGVVGGFESNVTYADGRIILSDCESDAAIKALAGPAHYYSEYKYVSSGNSYYVYYPVSVYYEVGGIVGHIQSTTGVPLILRNVKATGDIVKLGTSDIAKNECNKGSYIEIGGIVGVNAVGGTLVLDGAYTDVSVTAAVDYALLGGGVGAYDTTVDGTKTLAVANSNLSTRLALLAAGSATSSPTLSYKGLGGGTKVWAVNNAVRSLLDANNSSFNSSSSLFGSNSGTGVTTANNFIMGDVLADGEAAWSVASKLTMYALGEGYFYDTYWNGDYFGNGNSIYSTSSYVDASSKPYAFTAEGIPVTADRQSVLGLLRYNAGHDGGVLSTEIPSSLGGKAVRVEYRDWKYVVDDQGRQIPVPASDMGWY